MIFEKEGKTLSLAEFEKLTGARWIPRLDFELSISLDFVKKGEKLRKKGEIDPEQLWLGAYFKKEITALLIPDVAIRWIDPVVGWGVFALRDFRKMEFIAEYTGRLRKKEKEDTKNSYCFEYTLKPGTKTSYTIDAREQGGVARYVNHSDSPNLNVSLATLDNFNHVILYTKEPVAKGKQLCYHYGPDYWGKRGKPISL